MNPQAIVRLLDQKPVGYACGQCGAFFSTRVYASPDTKDALAATVHEATRCCNQTCLECGKDMHGSGSVCGACRSKKWAEQRAKEETEAFAKAKKVALVDYTGTFVYIDGAHNEGFVLTEETEEAIETLLDRGREAPAYAWSCDPDGASFDLTRAIQEAALQEHHEDAFDQVDEEKLDRAQALINDALAKVETYRENRSLAVLLPVPRIDAEGFVQGFDPPVMPAEVTAAEPTLDEVP